MIVIYLAAAVVALWGWCIIRAGSKQTPKPGTSRDGLGRHW